jgi:hypothetical protein
MKTNKVKKSIALIEENIVIPRKNILDTKEKYSISE